MSLNRLTILRAAVAFVALALVLLPGEAWSGPASDYKHSGFDADLIYEVGAADGGAAGQAVEVGDGEMSLVSVAGRDPEVHVITTPLSFVAGFTATVADRSEGATPLRAKVWNPRNDSSLEVVFGADGLVRGSFNEAPGRVAREAVLTSYESGVPYEVAFEWERSERGGVTVTGPETMSGFELTEAEAPALFDAYRPTLTVSAAARDGSSAVSLTDYQLDLPPARFTTLRTDDAAVPPLTGLLTALGAGLLLAAVTPRRVLRWLRSGLANGAAAARRQVVGHPLGTSAVALALGGYAGANMALFTVGSQPFDMGSQTAWAYIAAEYGVADLYYAAQTATLADVWGGVPYHEAVFPYNAGMSYYFWLIGETHLLLFGHASPDSTSMEMTIKAFNLGFLLADAALVYAIVRHLKPASRYLPWAVAGILLFNPAVVFDTAIWGETESVVLFPLLASLLAALKDRPGLAWPLLALAFLSKQTVLLPVLAIALFYLARFDLRRNLEGFSAGMVVVLAVILPFTLNGYPPSIAIDPTLAAAWAHGGSGAERAFQVVSYDSFNVWTLVTSVADGAAGIGRFQAPDYQDVLGSFSYRELGLVALATSLGALALAGIARGRSVREPEGAIFTVVALVVALELFLPTQTLSRYWVLAIAFASVGLAGRWRWLSACALAAFTVTAFAGQYGSMALVLQDFPQHGEWLAPQNNAVSRAMLHLFTSDAFITISVLANACAIAALGAALWLSGREASRIDEKPAQTAEDASRRRLIPVPSETWVV